MYDEPGLPDLAVLFDDARWTSETADASWAWDVAPEDMSLLHTVAPAWSPIAWAPELAHGISVIGEPLRQAR